MSGVYFKIITQKGRKRGKEGVSKATVAKSCYLLNLGNESRELHQLFSLS